MLYLDKYHSFDLDSRPYFSYNKDMYTIKRILNALLEGLAQYGKAVGGQK